MSSKLAKYVNEHYDVRELYKEVTGRVPPEGKCFCPFHHNVNTPAAKIYGNALKCFGQCNRLFTPYDFLKKFFPEELTKVVQSVVLEEYSTSKKSFKFLKRGEIDLSQPLECILKSIIKLNEGCKSSSQVRKGS